MIHSSFNNNSSFHATCYNSDTFKCKNFHVAGIQQKNMNSDNSLNKQFSTSLELTETKHFDGTTAIDSTHGNDRENVGNNKSKGKGGKLDNSIHLSTNCRENRNNQNDSSDDENDIMHVGNTHNISKFSNYNGNIGTKCQQNNEGNNNQNGKTKYSSNRYSSNQNRNTEVIKSKNSNKIFMYENNIKRIDYLSPNVRQKKNKFLA